MSIETGHQKNFISNYQTEEDKKEEEEGRPMTRRDWYTIAAIISVSHGLHIKIQHPSFNEEDYDRHHIEELIETTFKTAVEKVVEQFLVKP